MERQNPYSSPAVDHLTCQTATLPKRRGSITSLLLVLSVAVVFLSFVKVAGMSQALSALKPATIFAVVVWGLAWAMHWGPEETRGRIDFLPVVVATIGTVAIAGLLYYYCVWHTFDSATIRPMAAKGDSRFLTWTLWGGCVGPCAGVAYNLLRSHRNSARRKPANAGRPQNHPSG